MPMFGNWTAAFPSQFWELSVFVFPAFPHCWLGTEVLGTRAVASWPYYDARWLTPYHAALWCVFNISGQEQFASQRVWLRRHRERTVLSKQLNGGAIMLLSWRAMAHNYKPFFGHAIQPMSGKSHVKIFSLFSPLILERGEETCLSLVILLLLPR